MGSAAKSVLNNQQTILSLYTGQFCLIEIVSASVVLQRYERLYPLK